MHGTDKLIFEFQTFSCENMQLHLNILILKCKLGILSKFNASFTKTLRPTKHF